MALFGEKIVKFAALSPCKIRNLVHFLKLNLVNRSHVLRNLFVPSAYRVSIRIYFLPKPWEISFIYVEIFVSIRIRIPIDAPETDIV